MSNNTHPNLQAKLSNLSDEEIERILTTKVPAVSLVERMKPLQGMLTNPNEITIEGWVAKDEAYAGSTYLHTEKPHPINVEFCDTGDYEVAWRSKGMVYLLDDNLFPDIAPETEPKKYRITIKPIDQ